VSDREGQVSDFQKGLVAFKKAFFPRLEELGTELSNLNGAINGAANASARHAKTLTFATWVLAAATVGLVVVTARQAGAGPSASPSPRSPVALGTIPLVCPYEPYEYDGKFAFLVDSAQGVVDWVRPDGVFDFTTESLRRFPLTEASEGRFVFRTPAPPAYGEGGHNRVTIERLTGQLTRELLGPPPHSDHG
jgi:hypothetical protein